MCSPWKCEARVSTPQRHNSQRPSNAQGATPKTSKEAKGRSKQAKGRSKEARGRSNEAKQTSNEARQVWPFVSFLGTSPCFLEHFGPWESGVTWALGVAEFPS